MGQYSSLSKEHTLATVITSQEAQYFDTAVPTFARHILLPRSLLLRRGLSTWQVSDPLEAQRFQLLNFSSQIYSYTYERYLQPSILYTQMLLCGAVDNKSTVPPLLFCTVLFSSNTFMPKPNSDAPSSTSYLVSYISSSHLNTPYTINSQPLLRSRSISLSVSLIAILALSTFIIASFLLPLSISCRLNPILLPAALSDLPSSPPCPLAFR